MITLSIGISTYERPNLLKRLLKSITDQEEINDLNIEILIGDDSKISIYNEIKDVENKLPNNISLSYLHHQPAKGQNRNVGSLINRSSGTFFCLMHDDDYFLKGAIKILITSAKENINCIVFGKQLLLKNNYDYQLSEKINNDFRRSTIYQGKQKDSVTMAMMQQCPNDGFILETVLAKRIGSRPVSIIGTACDFDFALRAAIVEKLDFFFIDQYTTVYAVSDDSVTGSFENNAGERKLKILHEFGTHKSHPKIFRDIMKADLSMVISHYIIVKNYIEAKQLLFSFNNLINYLWYKPATYIQLLKVILKR